MIALRVGMSLGAERREAAELKDPHLIRGAIRAKCRENWIVVFTPAGAPVLQKAEFHCRVGAPAGQESQRVG